MVAALAVVVARGVVGGTNDKAPVRRDGEVGTGGCFLVVDVCDTLEFGAGVTFTVARWDPPPPSRWDPPSCRCVICPSSIRTPAIPACLLLSLWDPPPLLLV